MFYSLVCSTKERLPCCNNVQSDASSEKECSSKTLEKATRVEENLGEASKMPSLKSEEAAISDNMRNRAFNEVYNQKLQGRLPVASCNHKHSVSQSSVFSVSH
jgi:hypothetical protein